MNGKADRNNMNLIVSSDLVNLIRQKYVERGETDEAFAAFASAELKARIITSHVTLRRTALGIKSNRDARRETKRKVAEVAPKIIDIIHEMQGQILYLMKRVQELEDKL